MASTFDLSRTNQLLHQSNVWGTSFPCRKIEKNSTNLREDSIASVSYRASMDRSLVPTAFNAKTPGRQDAKRLKKIRCVLSPLRLCVEKLVTGERLDNVELIRSLVVKSDRKI